MVKLGMFEGVAKDAMAAATGKAEELVREFNRTVPALKALGLSVTNVRAKLGLPPEVGATLIGAIDALDRTKLRELGDQYKDNRNVAVVIEALIAASNLKDQLDAIGFRGLKADVTFGLAPRVEIDLLAKSEPLPA